jgi:CrcB protein
LSADVRELGAVFAGGAIGAVARAETVQAWPVGPGGWPWATFAVNCIGALMLGYFVTRLTERLPPSAYRRPFLGTGICGGLTTFSTMQVELLQMLNHGRFGLALAYAAGSIAAGAAGVQLASNLVRRGGAIA